MQKKQVNQTNQTTQTKLRNNSKSVLHFTAIMLTVVMIVSLAIGLFAWSKYTATQSGSANAVVAKWNFNLSLKSGATTVTGNQTLNLADTLDQETTHVANGKIAPGTSGTFDIEIDTSGTEVSMVYDVTIGMTNCPRNIKFSKKGPGENSFIEISPMQTGDDTTRARTINFSKYLRVKDDNQENENGIKTETIKWEWSYELTGNDPTTNQPYTDAQKTAYDARDNADQGQTVNITITAVGTEVMNSPLSMATITDKNNNPLHNGDTLEVYAGATSTINIPAGTEGVTISSSDTTVATVSISTNEQTGVTTGTVTGVAAGNAVITITGQETGKTTSINITVKPAITAKVNGVDTLITQEDTGLYYGCEVTNYTVGGEKYQLFFVDYNGKYGNKGDIYLKKMQSIPRSESLPINDYDINSTNLKIKQMNKLWANSPNQTINTEGEKAVAWLCDTTVWSQYAVGDYARYAIGGPSVEIMVDSYNQAVDVYNRINNTNYEKSSYSLPNATGYIASSARLSVVGQNSMYNSNDHYWIASTYYGGSNGVLFAYNGFFYNYYGGTTYSVDPIICLQSDFPLQLELNE